MTIDDHADWQLDVTTGQWSVDQTGSIPQAGWSLLYADSEETQAEDGHGDQRLRRLRLDLWHTQYTGSAPAHPHELQIDLGATYAVARLRYLPRQDKDDHGMVADYQFYVSTTRPIGGRRSRPAPSPRHAARQTVPFAATTARYIRFVALCEINGQPWASIAELRMVGAPNWFYGGRLSPARLPLLPRFNPPRGGAPLRGGPGRGEPRLACLHRWAERLWGAI